MSQVLVIDVLTLLPKLVDDLADFDGVPIQDRVRDEAQITPILLQLLLGHTKLESTN